MSRFFTGLVSQQSTKEKVPAIKIQTGDYIRGEQVNHVDIDIGMVVVYYTSGNYTLFNKFEQVEVIRRHE